MRLSGACFATLLLVAAAPAAAQDSGIAGAVNDNTGGVLPGVTVEAASPALIEGSRLAVTDAQGRYAFTALRPGVYTVTFTLTGFATVMHEGVELTAGFTARSTPSSRSAPSRRRSPSRASRRSSTCSGCRN